MQIPIKNLCHLIFVNIVIAHISSTTYMAISSDDDDFALMEFILKKQGNLIQIVLIKTFIY